MQVDAQLLTRLQLWYAREARLLDERRFDHWLEQVDPVIRYRIPTRYLTEQGRADDFAQWSVERELGTESDLFMLDDDYEALRGRIDRLRSGMAWAETPPSFTRRLVGNVEPIARGPEGELEVYTAILLYKSRGPDSRTLLSAQRRDVLADTSEDFRLRKRTAILDDTVLMGENLSTIL